MLLAHGLSGALGDAVDRGAAREEAAVGDAAAVKGRRGRWRMLRGRVSCVRVSVLMSLSDCWLFGVMCCAPAEGAWGRG